MSPLLLGLLLACGSPDPADSGDSDTPIEDPLSWAVDEPGPYNVGYRQWEITYEPMSGESRTVMLNIWYPTDATSGDDLKYAGIAPAVGVAGNAPPAPSPYPGGFPVHAHSHGDQGYGATSADLMIWFATHGWISVSPDHTDNLLFSNVQPTPVGHYYHRPRDVIAVVDALDALPADDPLAGTIDTSTWLVSGHSRGATTVWSLTGATFDPAAADTYCEGCDAAQVALFADLGDPRIAAAAPMAGTYRASFFGETGYQSVAMPVMSLTGSEDGDGQQDQWDRIEGIDFTWLDFEGGCHQTFALGTCATLPTEDGYRMTNTYLLALGRSAVLGDQSDAVQGILDGTIEVDPRVSFQRR